MAIQYDAPIESRPVRQCASVGTLAGQVALIGGGDGGAAGSWAVGAAAEGVDCDGATEVHAEQARAAVQAARKDFMSAAPGPEAADHEAVV
jgi:hypothetical protein